MFSSHSRFLAACGAVLMLGIAACGEPRDPVGPSTATLDAKPQAVPLLTTSAFWDFAAIIPGTDDPEDLGTTETISLAGNGSILATTGGPGEHVTVKGRSLPVGDTERGLGLCLTTEATCTLPLDGDEVGDGGPGALLLDFDGVLPEGSTLQTLDLGSVQVDEGYKVSVSTDGGLTFGTPVEAYDGDADDNVTLTFDLPTDDLVIKLEKAADLPDVENDNDYTVRSVTTQFTTTSLEGRMTGGGIKATGTEGEIVTFGLTLHCDITLSNNLQVNWAGHRWHLAKPITSATCDNIQMDPEPPASPIDTFEGEGYGRLNNVGDSFVQFRFEDHGEPGRNDRVAITIYEPGTYDPVTETGTVALEVELQNISVGNWQMHYDQPHGQKK